MDGTACTLNRPCHRETDRWKPSWRSPHLGEGRRLSWPPPANSTARPRTPCASASSKPVPTRPGPVRGHLHRQRGDPITDRHVRREVGPARTAGHRGDERAGRTRAGGDGGAGPASRSRKCGRRGHRGLRWTGEFRRAEGTQVRTPHQRAVERFSGAGRQERRRCNVAYAKAPGLRRIRRSRSTLALRREGGGHPG